MPIHSVILRRASRQHITDCQTRLYMKSRQNSAPAVAAAKAGISRATAYVAMFCKELCFF
jgi:hypothetical protein